MRRVVTLDDTTLAITVTIAFFPIRVSERGYAIDEMWRKIKQKEPMTSRTSPWTLILMFLFSSYMRAYFK